MWCKLCGETVENGEEHMQYSHSDICDQLLQEYIPDSVREAVEQYIDESEDEEV